MTKLHDGGFPSPAAVPPARKKSWYWCTRAASAHPKKTSPVANDIKLYDGGFTSPAAVYPARKNVRDWSARATLAHPKNTSPVADDDKASNVMLSIMN
ncbi:hypothetical protein CQW23_24244 [Capsicum baccatum]|uniref:Uncharacterized protein n=1 Tax=Capsicum baccatum TaxID=33114 RepID=A0A2G2VUA0_CAPBA|nr:hypothetical protein CQW23_24244 [Capsicum baccatum]